MEGVPNKLIEFLDSDYVGGTITLRHLTSDINRTNPVVFIDIHLHPVDRELEAGYPLVTVLIDRSAVEADSTGGEFGGIDAAILDCRVYSAGWPEEDFTDDAVAKIKSVAGNIVRLYVLDEKGKTED